MTLKLFCIAPDFHRSRNWLRRFPLYGQGRHCFSIEKENTVMGGGGSYMTAYLLSGRRGERDNLRSLRLLIQVPLSTSKPASPEFGIRPLYISEKNQPMNEIVEVLFSLIQTLELVSFNEKTNVLVAWGTKPSQV